MTNWFTVFKYEFMLQVGRKAFLFTAFGIPLIVLALYFGYTTYQDRTADNTDESVSDLEQDLDGEKPIGYIDETGAFPAPADDSPFTKFVTYFPTFEEGEQALKNDDIVALYVVEADYFETGAVTQWMDGFDFNALLTDVMEPYLLYSMGQDLEPVVLGRLRVPVTAFNTLSITDAGAIEPNEGSFDTDFLQVYVFTLAMMISIFSASGYLMQSVISERENKTVEIILTSVRPLPLLLGKVIAMSFIGLMTIAAWMATLLFIANQSTTVIVDLSAIEVEPTILMIGAIYFLLGYGFMSGIYASVGTMFNSMREAQTFAGWLVLPMIIPMLVITLFIEDPNGTLPTILSLVPFTAPLAMVMRATVTDIPIGELALSIALMLVLVAGSIWLASRLFRVSTLLQGNAPRLRDIPKLIFQT